MHMVCLPDAVLFKLVFLRLSDSNQPLSVLLWDFFVEHKMYVPWPRKHTDCHVLHAVRCRRVSQTACFCFPFNLLGTRMRVAWMRELNTHAWLLRRLHHEHTLGAGVIAEVNCTLCYTGKYQTGSGCLNLCSHGLFSSFLSLFHTSLLRDERAWKTPETVKDIQQLLSHQSACVKDGPGQGQCLHQIGFWDEIGQCIFLHSIVDSTCFPRYRVLCS